MASDANRDNFGVMVHDLARLWRANLNKRLKPLGLSQAKWQVILHLSRTHTGMVQKELAERLGIEGPSLVGLLDRMATGGWIERRPSPNDRRCNTVHLTRKSQETARRIRRVTKQVREDLLADLNADDLAHCAQVFGAITARAEALRESDLGHNGSAKTLQRGKS